jgi:hypothetical protein
MTNPIDVISGKLSSADTNFLKDPPKWIDFASHPSMPQTPVAPSPATCRLVEYYCELLSLLMQVNSISHVPSSGLWFQCHLTSSLKLRLKTITKFIQFCYKRQMRYCMWLFIYTYFLSTNRSSPVEPLQEVNFDFQPYRPPLPLSTLLTSCQYESGFYIGHILTCGIF